LEDVISNTDDDVDLILAKYVGSRLLLKELEP